MSLRDWKRESQNSLRAVRKGRLQSTEVVMKAAKCGALGPRPEAVGVGAYPRGYEADSERAIENQEGGATLKSYHLRELQASRMMLGRKYSYSFSNI